MLEKHKDKLVNMLDKYEDTESLVRLETFSFQEKDSTDIELADALQRKAQLEAKLKQMSGVKLAKIRVYEKTI